MISSEVSAELQLERGIEEANIPALVLLLVQLTGDMRWLRAPFTLTKAQGLDDNDSGGLSLELQRQIREAALKAVLAWRAGRPVAIREPSAELSAEMLSCAMGEPVPLEYGPLIVDALGGAIRADRHERIAAIPEGFEVLIIGASFAGICAAAYLQRSGIPFKIVERNENVGGTWLMNRYPGCGVDTPSHYYSYGFVRHDWSQYFALRDEMNDYLRAVSDELNLAPLIEFETSVDALSYDEESQRWIVSLTKRDGTRATYTPNVVISAVGIFNPPKMPSIPGLDAFKGRIFHSAEWPHDIDVANKNVAIIGNGASAMQIGPEIQRSVKSLTVYQRSPHWIVPFPQFRKNVPSALRFFMQEVPLYEQWYRARIAWKISDANYPLMLKDPDWPHPERSLNQRSEDMRNYLTQYIMGELGSRTDLAEKVVPPYPPWGKRMLRDNGWYRMLTRPNVALVMERITRLTETGVETQDGAERQADVVILATGFDVSRFLSTYEIHGRSGRSIRDVWDDDNPSAYNGVVVPDFPNFFCLYGPNTQPVSGSLVYILEMQMNYVMSLLHKMLARHIGSFEVRQDVHDAFNIRLDEQNEKMIWTHKGVTTYYRNERGRVVVCYPFRNVDLFESTRDADLSEYRLEPARNP